MRVFRTISDLRIWRAGLTGSVGLVPTMGALHDGHLALVRRARQENDFVGVSIFVNPRQFGEGEDFTRYPRPMERDLTMLGEESVDAVFIPDATEMYPPGALTEIHVRELSERLEGASRPGHFQGVAVIVCKLLNIFQPDRAYFGQKDAQQAAVVRKMVEDLNVPVEIVAAHTVRDPDGVALSSRNVYLNDDERSAARRIPEALFAAQRLFRDGERSAERLRELVREIISREPLLQLEYVSVADAGELRELENVDVSAVLSVAVQCGLTRLIDNVRLGDADWSGFRND